MTPDRSIISSRVSLELSQGKRIGAQDIGTHILSPESHTYHYCSNFACQSQVTLSCVNLKEKDKVITFAFAMTNPHTKMPLEGVRFTLAHRQRLPTCGY